MRQSSTLLKTAKALGLAAGGRPVDVLLETKGTNKPDEGLTKARKLVERDRVHVLGGIIATPVAYALRPYVIEKKVPIVIMNAGADELTKKLRSSYIFRAAFSNSDGSHALGEWAYRQGYRKMVLMASDFGGAIEHIGGVARTFIEAGGRVIQEIYPAFGTPDFAPYLAQIRRDADVVATAIFAADSLRFVKQYDEFGLKEKIPLVGKALTLEDVLSAQGDAAIGVISVSHYTTALDNPENKHFVQAFETRYKKPAAGFAEQGYVGAQMIAKALEAVKGNIENTPIASFPDTSQFWKWTPEQFMAMPGYLEMKGKWAK